MIKKSMPALLLLPFVAASAFAVETAVHPAQTPYVEQSRKIAKGLMQSLGSTLKSQLEAGGATSAIGICKHVAPSLAAEYSKNGWKVSRISLKPRNQALGTPDAWERANLKTFDTKKDQAGTAMLETSEIIEDSDGRRFRYMKAIPTQAMCLQCHGQKENIPDDVKAVLAWEYPEDQATGYKVGDIRGAVSIEYQLPE